MPVQCNICLGHDTDTEWSVLSSCGHTFHTVCLQQELEYRRRCPNCRVDIPKGRPNSLPYRKVFFELTDEPADDSGGGSGGGEGGGVDVSAGQLQMKLLVKEQELQRLKVGAREAMERIEKLEGDLALTQKSLRKAEEKLNVKIGEVRDLGRQNKAAHNELANLRVELSRSQLVEGRVKLVADASLQGDTLYAELKKLMDRDVQVPGWFPAMLEVRNKQISAVTNKVQQAERAKQQAEGQLRHEIHKLQQQVSKLQQQLEAAQQRRQQQQAAVEPGQPSWHAPGSGSGRPRGGAAVGSARAFGSSGLGGSGLDDGMWGGPGDFLDFVPAPRYSSAAAGSKPSLRQRMQRLTGKAAPSTAAAAAAHAGALGHAAAAAEPSAQHPHYASASLGHPAAAAAAAVAAAAATTVDGAAAASQEEQQWGDEEDDSGEFVLLEDSEEQPLGLGAVAGLGEGDRNGGAAGTSGQGKAQEDPGEYSEVDSEDELDIVEESPLTSPSPQQQRQQRPAQQQEQWRGEGQWASGPGAAPPAAAVAAGPSCSGQGPALLGKRRSPEAAQQLAGPSWQHAGAASSSGRGDVAVAQATVLRPSNRAGYNPIPLKAGPSRLGAGPGTGPSFLRDPQRATTGLDDQAKYIHRGPDGKGGLVSVYKNGGGGGSGGMGEARLRVLQQAQLKPQAAPAAAGASKKQKGSKAAGSSAARGAAANGGCTIDLFFNRAS